jgi:DNA-binding response OmpR family regulator
MRDAPGGTLVGMTTVLLVADHRSTIDRVHASLSEPGIELIDHPDPGTAADTAYALGVDAVVVDMQVGSMGAMAVARAVRSRAGDGDAIPVTILLDREADGFLAGRSGARHWLLKSAPATDLRAAVAGTQAAT